MHAAPTDCPDITEKYTKLIDHLKWMGNDSNGDNILQPKFIENAIAIHEQFPCILTVRLLERIVSVDRINPFSCDLKYFILFA